MFDVIIIGAGHAGCEAALASARLGAKTLLLTINLDSIAAMPCNCAIGGPGRGQMVREIDALGGEIAKNTDRTYMHMRMQNTSKGPAVRTLRALVDKRRYFLEMKKVLENQNNLAIRQALAVNIIKTKKGYGVITSDGFRYDSRSVVFCNGTFLNGVIFWGKNRIAAGRHGEIPSNHLAQNLKKMGIGFGRLRTTTPPRVDKKTIDFHKFDKQPYDIQPEMFSHGSHYDGRKQLYNYITYVDENVIGYIKKNILDHTSNPIIKPAEGPKYCPSIEEKIIRFPHRKRHLLFIQPEGIKTNEMYVHGLMTSLGEKFQYSILNRIKGLENAVITRVGYGVEYDFILPYQINRYLESKTHKRLFFAGQINGTTGYEEAAAQGIIAGINAAKTSFNQHMITINREDGYIGILLDDLITKGFTEPYRMLTSRNEYRLYHRHDNADFRMLPFLKDLGQSEKGEQIRTKYRKIHKAIHEISKNDETVDSKKAIFLNKYRTILLDDFHLSSSEIDSVYINLKYKHYIKRQIKDIKKIEKSLDLDIPENINYEAIGNLSNEAIARLKKCKPGSLRQARRLEGISPSDLFALLCYLKKVSP